MKQKISSKIDLEDIEKAINKSSNYPLDTCLYVLRDELNNLGYNFPRNRLGEKQAYEEAFNYWWDIRENKIPLDEIPYQELEDLPATVVEKGNIKYYIHGVVHGTIIWWRPKRLLKDFVKKCAKNYHQPPESICLYEHGMDETFGIDEGYDFNDWCVLEFGDLYMSSFYDLVFEFLTPFLQFLRKENRIISKTIKDGLKDPGYLPHVREIFRRTQLTEPLYMNYIREDKYYSRFATLRSAFMSEVMQRYAQVYQAKEVHAIVGFAHEPQIEYFLKSGEKINPELIHRLPIFE